MIKRLLLLNGLSIFNVVLYHASAWGFIAMFWWTDRYLPVAVPNFDQKFGLTYFTLRSIEQYIIYSIPAFLFVSGFFISVATGRRQATISWKLIGARIKALVIPYLIWSTVMLFMEFFQGRTFSPLDILRILLTGQATEAFYFVPLLVQLYILAPFIVPIAKKNWKALLLVAWLIEFGIRSLNYGFTLGIDIPILHQLGFLTNAWLFPVRIFWFVLGIVVGFHLGSFRPTLKLIRWGLVAGAIFFFLVGVIEWEVLLQRSGEAWIAPYESVIDGFYALAFILAFLSFENLKIPLSKHFEVLGTKSYGIYLSHSLVIILTSKLVYRFVPQILQYQIIFQPLLIVLGLGVPLVLMALLNRSPFRRYYVYLFG
jgi:peptidoglycan/LPS O-acetylase OafA/YrhL